MATPVVPVAARQHNPQWGPRAVEPQDEHFWHATTFTGLMGLYWAPSIDPTRGGGANGAGFYVCPQRSDYQKVMAYRNSATQTDVRRQQKGLFLLKILAKGFYDMTGAYADGLGVPMGDEDFAGSRWARDVIGWTNYNRPDGTRVNYEERTKLADMAPKAPVPLGPLGPSAKPVVLNTATVTDTAAGKRVVKTKLTLGADDWKDSMGKVGFKVKDQKLATAREVLWQLARQNAPTLPTTGALVTTGLEMLDRLIMTKGARKAFRYSLEEVTFRAKAGPKLFIVDAYRFYYTGPNTDPAADDYDREQHIGLDELAREVETFPA